MNSRVMTRFYAQFTALETPFLTLYHHLLLLRYVLQWMSTGVNVAPPRRRRPVTASGVGDCRRAWPYGMLLWRRRGNARTRSHAAAVQPLLTLHDHPRRPTDDSLAMCI